MANAHSAPNASDLILLLDEGHQERIVFANFRLHSLPAD